MEELKPTFTEANKTATEEKIVMLLPRSPTLVLMCVDIGSSCVCGELYRYCILILENNYFQLLMDLLLRG